VEDDSLRSARDAEERWVLLLKLGAALELPPLSIDAEWEMLGILGGPEPFP
jgi:hypothetical protein